MSDKANATPAKIPSGHGTDWASNPAAAMMEGGQRALSQWFQTMVAISQEVTEFTQARMREDMTAWSALTACRNPGAALECQKRYAATASQQYADEFAALSRLMAAAAQSGLAATGRQPPAAGKDVAA